MLSGATRESGGIRHRQHHLVPIPFHPTRSNSATPQPHRASGEGPSWEKCLHQAYLPWLNKGTTGCLAPRGNQREVGVWKCPNQAMPLSRAGQILVVQVTPREREICHHPPQSVCPVPQHHSLLLCRLALFLVFLWAPSSRAGWKADGGTLVPLEVKAQALPAALGTLHRPQPLCHLCLGWIFKNKIPVFSERAYIASVLVKRLTPLCWNLRPHRQRISYS